MWFSSIGWWSKYVHGSTLAALDGCWRFPKLILYITKHDLKSNNVWQSLGTMCRATCEHIQHSSTKRFSYFSSSTSEALATRMTIEPNAYAVGVGRHEQAELTRETTFTPQALEAYSGTSPRSTDQPSRKSPQNSCDSSNRPLMLVARMARRQLSALQGCTLGQDWRRVIFTRKPPRSIVLMKMKPDGNMA